MKKTMEVTTMVRINRDKARIDVYIDMLEKKTIVFSEVDKRWKEKVRKELKKRGLEKLAD